MSRSLAADIGQRPCLLQRISARAAWRQHHTIAQLRKREEVPAVQRYLHHLPVLDYVAELRVRPQQGRIAGDHHLFGHAAGFELEIDAERLPELQSDARSNRSPESRELRADRVRARAKRCEEISALTVGHALDARAAVELLRHDDHAGQHPALRVADDAGDFTGVGLRSGRGGDDCNQRGR